MTRKTCHKCGWPTLRGPRFVRDANGERLTWKCSTCKFAESAPTVEAEQKREREMSGKIDLGVVKIELPTDEADFGVKGQ